MGARALEARRVASGGGGVCGEARGRGGRPWGSYLSSSGVGSPLGRPGGVVREEQMQGSGSQAAVAPKRGGRDLRQGRRGGLGSPAGPRGCPGSGLGTAWQVAGLRTPLPTHRPLAAGGPVSCVAFPPRMGTTRGPRALRGLSSRPGWPEAALLLPLPEGHPRKSAAPLPGAGPGPWGPWPGWKGRGQPRCHGNSVTHFISLLL